MTIYKRGDIWWYGFVYNGQRFRESTECTRKTEAKEVEMRRREELRRGEDVSRSKGKQALFPAATKVWMDTNKARWSKSNVDIQEYNIRHLTGHFSKTRLCDIRPHHIGEYQSLRLEEKASGRTCNMEVATLRMILKASKLWGNLADDVRMLPERKDVGRALSADEEMRLLAACRKSLSRSLYCAVVIFSNTGLRNAELRRAQWFQLDFLKAEFQVGHAKTAASTGRIIPLNRAALEAFQEWRALWPDAKPSDCIFPQERLSYANAEDLARGVMTAHHIDPTKPLGSWKTAWNTAKKTAGVECRMHDLRHTFVSRLAETRTPDATIKSITGHLSQAMLERYSHVRGEARRDAVALLDMRAPSSVQ
jgi:integrase